jgi:hypothetical protein
MRLAWPGLEHRFSVRRDQEDIPMLGTQAPLKLVKGHHRFKPDLLVATPVDLLVIEQGYLTSPPTTFRRFGWENLVETTPASARPKVVIESYPHHGMIWAGGPMCKATMTRWHTLGYRSRCKLVGATEVGGAIRQGRLLIARVTTDHADSWMWGARESDPDVCRLMSNLLTLSGLLRGRGTVYLDHAYHAAPNSATEPMPGKVGGLFRTDRGVRHLNLDETGRGLGLPKDCNPDLTDKALYRTTSVSHWEYLSDSFLSKGTPGTRLDPTSQPSLPMDASSAPTEYPPFEWKPPDLREEGAWWQERVANLWKAAATLDHPEEAYQNGLGILNLHR